MPNAEKFLAVPSTFLVQLVVLVNAFMVVGTVMPQFRLAILPPQCQAIFKSGGVPPVSYGVGATGHPRPPVLKISDPPWTSAAGH